MDYSYEDLAKMIDHALLVPTTTVSQLEAGCRLAVSYDVASVCIMPYYVRRCTELLAESTVLPSTVIGFPLGGHATSTKVAEAEQALADGCCELDMVVNISQVLSEKWEYVEADIRAVIDVAHAANQKVKVIFENCYLEDKHKIRLCEICSELEAGWVKTSTGFGRGGATIEDLQLMRKHSAESVQVKAAGGIRDVDTILKVREFPVTRIGTSSTKKLLDDWRKRLGLEMIETEDASATSGY